MKKSCTYRLNAVTLAKLEEMQDLFHWNNTELIEKGIDLLYHLSLASIHQTDSVITLPDTEKKILCKIL